MYTFKPGNFTGCGSEGVNNQLKEESTARRNSSNRGPEIGAKARLKKKHFCLF